MNAAREVPMKLLVAIDGSPASDVGVALVRGLDWPEDSEVVVAHAVDFGAGLFGGPWPALAADQVERVTVDARADAQRVVHEAAVRLARPGLIVREELLAGRAATTLVDRAASMDADLIVVGSRGHGGISRMVLGSVTAEIVSHANSPVLVARGSAADRVVLAWDGSSSASRAADLVATCRAFRRADVHVVSVMNDQVP